MTIPFHPHALERMEERGVSKDEARHTLEDGEQFPAKFGRIGYRRNFLFKGKWRDKYYHTKQVEVYAVKENNSWLVITVIAHYF